MFEFDEHRATEEATRRSIHQEDKGAESIASRHTDDDILNDQDAEINKDEEQSGAEKEVQGTKKPDYTEKRTSIYGEGLSANTQSQMSSVPACLASSDSNSSPTISSSAADATNDILSKKSFASSIKNSFDILNSLDLNTRKVRESSESFFFGAEIHTRNRNQNTQEEIDSLIALANKFSLRLRENKAHQISTYLKETRNMIEEKVSKL